MKNLMPTINMKSIPKSLNEHMFNAYFSTIAGNIDKEFDQQPNPIWKEAENKNNFKFNNC